MKLVKSLLLGSAAGLLAVASSQAADLPYRKAAPVEFVKICDAHGAGFFYIPGSDTCLRVGGTVQAEYSFRTSKTSIFGPGADPAFAVAGQANSAAFFKGKSGYLTVGNVGVTGVGFNGTTVSGRNRDESGSFARAEIDLDARNTTAVGTLRTFMRVRDDVSTGVNNDHGYTMLGADQGSNDHGTTTNIELLYAYIQWAGLTAGRYQSVFDFYGDNWNYAGIGTFDQQTEGISYTATFGGGFSATLSLEDHNTRLGGITSSNGLQDFNGDGGPAINAFYRGQQIPDIVGQLNLTQSWGQIQVSGAAHQMDSVISAFATPSGTAGIAALPTSARNDHWGFAVKGGVEFNLPVLAAGDQFWLEGTYADSALGYLGLNFGAAGGVRNFMGNGLIQSDYDTIWFINGAGNIAVSHPTGWDITAAFQHYFTPNFIGRVFGSYINVDYNRAAAAAANTSSYDYFQVGGQLIWEPLKGFDLGVEAMYVRLHNRLPVTLVDAAGNAIGRSTSDGFEGTLHIERDF